MLPDRSHCLHRDTHAPSGVRRSNKHQSITGKSLDQVRQVHVCRPMGCIPYLH